MEHEKKLKGTGGVCVWGGGHNKAEAIKPNTANG